MTSTTPANLPNQNDDEIDLGQLVGSLRRQWKLIGGVTLATVLVSALYTYSRRPTWEGRFDIVLKQSEGNTSIKAQLLGSNPALGSFLGGGGGASELETQVEILNSTSVLNPIFQYVFSEKPTAEAEGMRFDGWAKGSLEIKLKKGTSVLNVVYRDSDKVLILPVLQRLSRTYQSYSGKDRRRGLRQGVAYLEQQVAKYRTQAESSLRNLQTYALAHDLTALLTTPGEDKSGGNLSVNTELQRAEATARVRTLKNQIALLDRSADTAIYTGLSVTALNQGSASAVQGQTKNTNLFDELKRVESSLAKQSVKFTNQDESIQQLKEQRRVLIGFVNQETRGILNAQLVAAEAELAAASRPKNVLFEFRKLQINSLRDEATLLKLEETYRGLQLEAARQEDPWELISTPTLLDKPVAPKKSQELALGLLAGLVLGSVVALVVDRRKGLVWGDEELQQLLGLPVLVRLNNDNNDEIELFNSLQPLVQGPLAGSGTVAVLSSSDRDTPIANAMGRQLGQRLHWLQLNEAVALKQSRECDQLLFQLDLGQCKREELQKLRQQLQLLSLQPLGIILVG